MRYLRVEFAGGGSEPDSPSAALQFHSVSYGTAIDHVQVHASLGDGIVFEGGTAHCGYCVVSEARGASLAWAQGWQGSAQHLYLQQGPEAIAGIRGTAGEPALQGGPPELWNATLVGGYNVAVPGGSPGTLQRIGPGIVLEGEASLTVCNVFATGFGGYAIDGSVASFVGGSSSVLSAILTTSGFRHRGASQVRSRFEPYVEYIRANPDLLNIRYEANPDPRPRSGSIALQLGQATMPPFEERYSRAAHYIGAFGEKNWLEEWTFFGPERDFEVPDE